MRRFGIGEVCRLLGIKPHVLRYWEQEIPFLDPLKSIGGRRVYSDRELNHLYRLKFLVQERRYTLEGAKLALLEELSDSRADGIAKIHTLRKYLFDAHDSLRALEEKSRSFTGKTLFPPGQEHIRDIWARLPEGKRRKLNDDLLSLSPGIIDFAADHIQDPGEDRTRTLHLEVCIRSRAPVSPSRTAEQALAEGRIAAVTLLPENIRGPESAVNMLGKIAPVLREAAYRWGRSFFWYIFSDCRDTPRIRRLMQKKSNFNFDRGRVVHVREPMFPYLDENKRLLVSRDGRVHMYPSGHAGAMMMLRSSGLKNHMGKRSIDTLYFLPANRFALRFPDAALLNKHFRRGGDISLTCLKGEGCYTSTGVYLASRDFVSRTGGLLPRDVRETVGEPLIPGPFSADERGETRALRIISGLFFLLPSAEKVWALTEDV
jgi:DNA-binding transcriptional MerR regulator